jgi:hypothetical protein
MFSFLSLRFLASALPFKMQHHSHKTNSAIHTFSITGVRSSNHRLQPYHSHGDIVFGSIECLLSTRRDRWLGDADQLCIQVSEIGPRGDGCDRYHDTQNIRRSFRASDSISASSSVWEAIDCCKRKIGNKDFRMEQAE